MIDQELLELAAKAAEIKLFQWVGKGCWMGDEDEDGYQTAPPDLSRWNPLADDGDALRLAVKLRIDLQFFSMHTEAWKVHHDSVCVDHLDDPYAATRRAIVRAAAELGKTL